MRTSYITVTEIPSSKASQEQLERLYQRYHFASGFCENKDVLEVACGAGIGLGYLARKARKVVGTDIDENNLKFAQEYYKNRKNIELKILDAHKLFFADKSFDVVILYEAIYYLTQPEKFIQEASRILRDNGIFILCTVNKDWSDFNPSPYSTKYFSAQELFSLLKKGFADIKLYGAFSTLKMTLKDKFISFIKRTAVNLHLIPKTMKRKEFLKSIFFGRLITIPPEIKEGMVKYDEPVSISGECPNREYKVLFAVAYLK
jgi:ubiquinone/menaquinone biosynthesis C-methylase UbiE